jgi:small subunit ribosomal protein S1
MQIEAGQIMKGKVVNLTDFGAFVDLGGVDGMIHISNIDHRHINHPSDVLEIGQEIDVRIDSIDVERERIALNRKAVLPDPWDVFSENYSVNELMEGVVTNVVDFGVFVAAPGGAQGLIHTSRMSSLGISTPRDMFREGDPVLVRIVGIDRAQQHIELSVDDVTVEEQEAWMFKRRQDDLGEEGVDASQGADASVDTVDTSEDDIIDADEVA